MARGFVYLAAIIDWFGRQVLSWKLSITMDVSFCLEALEEALGKYGNDYSVPTPYGHREALVKGYVHEVVIANGSKVIARHTRSYEREAVVYDPLHYLELLEQKTRALDQAAPLVGWQLPECLHHSAPPARSQA